MYIPRITSFNTSVAHLVSNGLIGEQSVNDCGFPSQDTLDENILSAFKDDPFERDFDPVLLKYQREFESQSSLENSDLQTSKNE